MIVQIAPAMRDRRRVLDAARSAAIAAGALALYLTGLLVTV